MELSPTLRTADGFELIGLSCLRQIRENELRLRHNDAQALHQLRVGFRKLRAAISLFKKLLKDRQSAEIATELRWMTQQLGLARDYEVFLRDVRTLKATGAAGEASLEQLEALLGKLHEAALTHARSSIDDGRYHNGLDRIASWLVSGGWATSPDERQRRRRDGSLRRFARKVLKRRAKKLIAGLTRIEQLDAPRRHRLRIAVKKLRYGVEFFAGLFPEAAHERKRFNKHLKELQEALGRLNDINVHEQLAPELLAHAAHENPSVGREAFALRIVASREAAQVSNLTRAATQGGARLAKDAHFWA